MYLHKTPFWLRLLYPTFTWRKPAGEKKIYLTFDDGPIPELTEWILNTLATYQAQATFFCVGDNIRKHPEIFERIQTEGHSIGNHTFHHLNGWKTPRQNYISDVTMCQAYLNKPPQLFRPPYGKVTRSQAHKLQESGYQIIMWDVLTADFDASLSPEKCLQNSLAATTDGSLVVFHDNRKASSNLTYVLPKYLRFFHEKGFTFAPL